MKFIQQKIGFGILYGSRKEIDGVAAEPFTIDMEVLLTRKEGREAAK